MKITKIFEPIASAISAALVISVLAYLTLETSAGIWLMFSFGATVFIVFVLPKLETAQPKNIFFGHLVSITVGIIFNETIGLSFYSLGLILFSMIGIATEPLYSYMLGFITFSSLFTISLIYKKFNDQKFN